MICAIGVRPEACASAYSLALRSLREERRACRGDPLQALLGSERDPAAPDALEVDRRGLTLLVAERCRSFPEQWQSHPMLAHRGRRHIRVPPGSRACRRGRETRLTRSQSLAAAPARGPRVGLGRHWTAATAGLVPSRMQCRRAAGQNRRNPHASSLRGIGVRVADGDPVGRVLRRHRHRSQQRWERRVRKAGARPRSVDDVEEAVSAARISWRNRTGG